MSEPFTVIIRSNDKLSSTDNTNNCNIRLNCPSQHRYLNCRVINFFLNTLNGQTFTSQSYVEVVTSGLEFGSGSDSSGNIKSVSFTNVNSYNGSTCSMPFKVANFNTRQVNFQLVNNAGTLLQGTVAGTTTNYNSNWVLVLECTGVDE